MLTTRQIKMLKDNYPAGSVVRLLAMDDIQAPPPGTLGTVAGVLVNWQNGSHLSLIYGKDKWEVIK